MNNEDFSHEDLQNRFDAISELFGDLMLFIRDSPSMDSDARCALMDTIGKRINMVRCGCPSPHES
ncbi:hypothetical protein [Stenoxybacter acetivorans]|uniref:hypothetical protein n=1 Tax=Stenoxybacter acetivorans TaxID=422441 RepID=UPI000568316F|nr:hypothetical protein [Stenoxybacter acetivorans]